MSDPSAFRELILGSDSVTAALQEWCIINGLPKRQIRAIRERTPPAVDAPDEVLDALKCRNDELRHRRVALVHGNIVLATAQNWYVFGRLCDSTNHVLLKTDTPFGTAVEGPDFGRRNVDIRFCDGDPTAIRSPGQTDPILEIEAVLYLRDSPIAFVHECFRSDVLSLSSLVN